MKKSKKLKLSGKRFLKNMMTLFIIVVICWIVSSYLEIVIKNLSDPIYSKYNFFVVMFKNFDELLKGGIF